MAKKKHEEEHENHERWLVSYADFITLLFAFFTILYATSQKDISKAQDFQKSLQQAFKSFIDFGGLPGQYVDHKEATQFLPPPIDVVPQEGKGPLEMQDYLERELDKEMTEDEDKSVEFYTDATGLRVSLASSTFFDPGDALIRQEALPALSKIAKALKKSNRNLIIEGHTDNQGIHTAKFPSNWELSATRACTIVRYFETQHAYPASKLAPIGYADQRPRFPNDTPEHRAKNRRIDILIVNDYRKPQSVVPPAKEHKE